MIETVSSWPPHKIIYCKSSKLKNAPKSRAVFGGVHLNTTGAEL
jgi:hypothetical protein